LLARVKLRLASCFWHCLAAILSSCRLVPSTASDPERSSKQVDQYSRRNVRCEVAHLLKQRRRVLQYSIVWCNLNACEIDASILQFDALAHRTNGQQINIGLLDSIVANIASDCCWRRTCKQVQASKRIERPQFRLCNHCLCGNTASIQSLVK
jgi:hypothetical protein